MTTPFWGILSPQWGIFSAGYYCDSLPLTKGETANEHDFAAVQRERASDLCLGLRDREFPGRGVEYGAGVRRIGETQNGCGGWIRLSGCRFLIDHR